MGAHFNFTVLRGKMPDSESIRHSWVDAWSIGLGVKFMAAEIHRVRVQKKSPELETVKRMIANELVETEHPSQSILQGYRDLYSTLRITDAVSSPEWLHKMIGVHGRLPQINTVVDAYNLISAKTSLVISAHDLKYVDGDVRIERTKGDEVFFPLGGEKEILRADEWAGKADNHILCRLNCKQSDLSKVTLATSDLLIYVQGNPVTPAEYLRRVLVEVCQYIIHFNGGEYYLLPERKVILE